VFSVIFVQSRHKADMTHLYQSNDATPTIP
jgi:hypothetical protein